MVIDVKGAFLYGKTKRNVYIWLPSEDPNSKLGLLGKLDKAMYGTRDAPQVWQEEVRGTMKSLEFKECVTQPGIYYHEERGLQVVSHVGDFLCVGPKQSLRWFSLALEEKYEIKVNEFNEEKKEVIFLGRRISWSEEGVSIEADPKHVVILLKEWGLEDCNPCDTPVSADEKGNEEDMLPSQATLFRRAAARINYLGQDRPDLNVVSRLLAMRMAEPKRGDEEMIKRALRYLKGTPRLMYQSHGRVG